LGSNEAVWNRRAVLRLPVAAEVPLAGSYSSALARMPMPRRNRPATNIIPFGSGGGHSLRSRLNPEETSSPESIAPMS